MSLRIGFLFVGLLILLVSLSACPRRPGPPLKTEPTATPAPSPTPTPPIYVPSKRIDTGKIFNGIQFRSTLETDFGSTATIERETPGSYEIDLHLKVKIPKPNTDLQEITKLNEQLPVVIPGLGEMIAHAKVSPFYDSLYRAKVGSLRQNLNRLDELLSRHNLYDCETILELEHPSTKRKALLIQADMDVDTDGSDSDRVQSVDAASSTYQTMTSYKWRKRTTTPNPLVPLREAKLKQYSQQLAANGVDATRAEDLRETITRLELEITELKMNSSLVSTVDPFIVLPTSMVGRNNQPFTPKVGDYCVVIHKDRLYPAILGDVGPSVQIGEASLRLAKEINSRATANNRPMSALKITYLVFPNTVDKPFGPPDYERWQARITQLLQEIGGYSGELHIWEDLTKPTPTPTPTPSPTPSASPTPTASPAATPSPGATPPPA
jgi:hypothetical protein